MKTLTCSECGSPLPKRFRKFCSTSCRQKATNRKYYAYQLAWGQKKRAEYSPNNKRCLYCGGWYVQVGTHIVQRHGQTAREYKEDNDLPLKKGIVPDWYRELKGNMALENGTVNNLKAGKKFWYVKGDERAKQISGWKGTHREHNEYS